MLNSQVYLVGAGSGDPELITLKGINALKKSQVIIYDRLANPALLGFAPPGCEKIYVGKAAGHHSLTQDEINKILVHHGKAGKVVTRLKGGDPFVFGRGGEEVEALKSENIPYCVISGISSAISVPSSVGIPVTHRGLSRSFTVVTAHTQAQACSGEDYETLAKLQGTLIFLMGLSSLEKITTSLICHGKAPETPCAVICQGTTAGELVIRGTLETLPSLTKNKTLPSPGIIVVGAVCALDFSPTIEMPLSGICVGLTGTAEFNQKLGQQLTFLGAQTQEIATLNLTPINQPLLENAIENIRDVAWVVFTSPKGVSVFFKALFEMGKDVRALGGLKFAVIGTGTKATLLEHGIMADLMPLRFTAKDLGELLALTVNKKSKIFIPRALEGNESLITPLAGHCFCDLPIYSSLGKVVAENWDNCNFIVFASSSAVNTFFKTCKPLRKGIIAVAIGRETEKALSNKGINNYVTANTFTAEGVVQKILSEVKNNGKNP